MPWGQGTLQFSEGGVKIVPDPKVSELWEKVLQEKRRELTNSLQNYDFRSASRKAQGQVVVAVLGHGKSGKDLVGSWLGEITSLEYRGSTSSAMLPYVAKALKQPEKEAWEERRQNRKFWRDFGDAMRAEDPTLLAKLNLANSDVIVGMRGKEEILGCVEKGVIQAIIWVNRLMSQPDPTMGVEGGELFRLVEGKTKTYWIDNNKGLVNLFDQVRGACGEFGINCRQSAVSLCCEKVQESEVV